jgi:hypothetical protein
MKAICDWQICLLTTNLCQTYLLSLTTLSLTALSNWRKRCICFMLYTFRFPRYIVSCIISFPFYWSHLVLLGKWWRVDIRKGQKTIRKNSMSISMIFSKLHIVIMTWIMCPNSQDQVRMLHNTFRTSWHHQHQFEPVRNIFPKLRCIHMTRWDLFHVRVEPQKSDIMTSHIDRLPRYKFGTISH